MKKSKFKGSIKDIEFYYIKEEMMKIPEFSDFNSWKIKKLNVGEMHHTYIFTKNKRKYFVKEVKPHEAQINYFLCILNLKHLPHAVYPELLKKKILIMPFIVGKMLRKRKIDYKLLKNFITFQNRMNNKQFFDSNNIMQLTNYLQKDDGFWLKNLDRDWEGAHNNLIFLKRRYPKLDVINNFIEILNYLKKDKNKIQTEFAKMPFARQHHDFREDNILVTKRGQVLIDWGSSYGYGPFMYDYSKFLINDFESFEIVLKSSNICKNVPKNKVQRWLYVALVKKMFNMLKWYIPKGHHNIETESKTKKMLEYEYKTYKYLLK